jgi:hypothetical protein
MKSMWCLQQHTYVDYGVGLFETPIEGSLQEMIEAQLSSGLEVGQNCIYVYEYA